MSPGHKHQTGKEDHHGTSSSSSRSGAQKALRSGNSRSGSYASPREASVIRLPDSVRESMSEFAAALSGTNREDTEARLQDDSVVLLRRYPAYLSWPADGIFAMHVLAWALGPGFRLDGLQRALGGQCPDFLKASMACRLQHRGNSAVVVVNSRTRRAFVNAHYVLELGIDPSRVYYPLELS